MIKYLDRETYRKLYARYLSENGRHVDELLDMAGGEFTGMRVLDLCGGAGEMARGAFERHAEYVLLMDGSEDMIGERDPNIEYCVNDIENFLEDPFWKKNEHQFDVVLCRQAVNYWLNEEMAEELSTVMEPGGIFVFNTFNRKPDLEPTIKKYEFQGVNFVEISHLGFDQTVYHVQIREGMEPHLTSFKWIATSQFYEWLSPWFKITRLVDRATTLYHCEKK